MNLEELQKAVDVMQAFIDKHQQDSIEIEKPLIEKSQVKVRHLDYVLLTAIQYDRVLELYGESNTAKFIDSLNNYIGQIGVLKANNRYKSHYHMLLKWMDKDPSVKKIAKKQDDKEEILIPLTPEEEHNRRKILENLHSKMT